MTRFDGPSWVSGAEKLDALREEWESATFPAAQAEPISAEGSNPVDKAVATATAGLRWPWYDAIGQMGVKLGSDASKMRATGEDYSATEDQAAQANDRFWSI
ncbi:hypothetical protein [uncultured Tessaracoccus sp.]|uniref:hypothetical protein n=1 Tax=uncultured Tessaracoccus sp. TaxID=905023 RepID=UPI0025E6F589|nr:hypothetical protein [uncultured Tessaracoccus sp.]